MDRMAGRARSGERRAESIQGGRDAVRFKLSEGEGGNPCQRMRL